MSGQHLFRLYGKIASSIRTPDSKLFGIQHKLDTKRAMDLPDSDIQDLDRYTHPLPAIVLEDYFHAQAEERDLLYGDLLGLKPPISEIKRIHKKRGLMFPKMPTFGVLKHGQAYFEVMSDILRWCGYKGLVILIDEIELIARLGKVGRLNAYRNLNWLLNWLEDKQFPFYCVGGVASPLQDLWLGSLGKRLPDREEIPKLALQKFDEEEENNMKSFFEEALNYQQCPSIDRLDRSQLLKILEMLINIHGISYDWDANIDANKLIDSVGTNPLRTHIRALLESLDIKFLYSVDFRPTINTEEFDLSIVKEDFFQEDK